MNMIAADVGGTKTRLVYVDLASPYEILAEARLASNDFSSFDALLSGFIAQIEQHDMVLERLSLALPGVVLGDTAKLTNLPWVINKAELETRFGFNQILFINDFQASAYGLSQMRDSDMLVLNPARHKNGATCVVLGAGTGLGLAYLQYENGMPKAYASEGGHIDFAPVNPQQIELLGFLQRRYRKQSEGHVSYERLLSGGGLVALYEFCSKRESSGVDPAWVSAAAKDDHEAQAAMQLFVQIYGSYVGNVAMLFNPEGGIYIAGGIAGKIIHWMQSADFIEAYLQKGRMQSLVKKYPVKIITNERVGALGALTYAVISQQVKTNDY